MGLRTASLFSTDELLVGTQPKGGDVEISSPRFSKLSERFVRASHSSKKGEMQHSRIVPCPGHFKVVAKKCDVVRPLWGKVVH